MRRLGLPAVVAGCLLALVLTCFHSVLFEDRQFALRDSGEFYYPLHQRIQQEWRAGRWPLWDPGENGGVPLLGNPSAAVLYPGKVLFLLPPAWGARAYVIAHVVLAFGTMLALLRWWGVSGEGSSLGALAYAFSGPVLFLYSNVIYLVGAAWTPLGLLAVDRLVRKRKRTALVELAVVLALQVLGGDPEAAYLVVVFGALYALGLVVGSRRAMHEAFRRSGFWLGLVSALLVALWIAATIGSACLLKRTGTRPSWPYSLPFLGWGVVSAWIAWRRPAGRDGRSVVGRLMLLVGSAALALGLGGAQVVPVLEFSRLSTRSDARGKHDIYPFSLEPVRLVEWAWPNVFGGVHGGERRWLHLLPPRHMTRLWVPSLYAGGLTLALAVGSIGFRGVPPWRAWLSGIAVVSLLGAFGEFGSPVWWARSSTAMTGLLGARDPGVYDASQTDDGVADGFGSVYGILASVLPAFQFFRYPSKLLTFTTLAMAGLAGAGWDHWREGRGVRPAIALLVGSLAVTATGLWFRRGIVSRLHAEGSAFPSTLFGPFDAAGAFRDVQDGLIHGSLALGCALALAAAAPGRRRWPGLAALIVLSVDLGLAGTPLIVTAPQAMFDATPRLARLIEQAEASNPSPGPFRVHRMTGWTPTSWSLHQSAARLDELIQWESDTLKPKYALNHGLSYTLTGGTLDLRDYEGFFGSLAVPYDPSLLNLRDAEPGQPILYYTRRGYDLWNTRYFVLPMMPGGWRDATRSFVAFLNDREMIAPDPRWLEDPGHHQRLERWIANEDWQLIRNTAAFPRAWVVHQARFLKPIPPWDVEKRDRLIEDLLFPNDPFWSQPHRRVLDPSAMACIETDDPRSLVQYTPRTPPDPSEGVTITRYDPQRVEIEARLNRPGLVILADVFYPGWHLTIDGHPAPILRANRLMRGAGVPAGTHHLVYRYDPRSFRVGRFLSLVCLSLLPAFYLGARRLDLRDTEGVESPQTLQ